MKHTRQAVATIKLNALHNNIAAIKSVLNSETKIMAVIKGNAYGHGIVKVAKALEEKRNVAMLGVSCLYEVIELRNNNIKLPILNLGATFIDDIDAIAEYNFIPTVFSLEVAEEISKLATKINKKIAIHIKVETGMNRIGVDYKDAVQLIVAIKSLPNIEIDGIFTHFANSDNLESDYTKNQISYFASVLNDMEKLSIIPANIHAANSCGAMFFKDSHFNMVRLGIALYGAIDPISISKETSIHLEPALSLKARISQIKNVAQNSVISYSSSYITQKDSKIATLSIGYADGVRRTPKPFQNVIVNGKFAPIVGRICMDQLMIDVTGIENVEIGSWVTIIGRDGDKEITIIDVANQSQTNTHEILCSISSRVSRVYD